MFNPAKLVLARKRRKLTAKSLAERAGLSAVNLSRIEKGHVEPEPRTVEALGRALAYPTSFFYGGDIEELPSEAASFRSLSAMTARERDAALAAGQLAFLFDDWIAERFDRPSPDLCAMADQHEPEAAARAVREAWALGEKPIGHVIKILEAKGVRVFSLAEETRTVDAFSCWRANVPYIFLNTFKTTEHQRFDAAHELGHLVLHAHGGTDGRHDVEADANRFASEFLMPRNDVLARIPYVTSLSEVVGAKGRWGVSVMALTYRLHKLGVISESVYRRLCIQANKAGYRRSEPSPMPRQRSIVWEKIFRDLWRSRFTKHALASELGLPLGELENLVFGLMDGHSEQNEAPQGPTKPTLRIVGDGPA